MYRTTCPECESTSPVQAITRHFCEMMGSTLPNNTISTREQHQ